MPRNVAATILEQLAAWGVKKIYGFIGDSIFYLFNALASRSDIDFYQVRHEETAAFMASAHAKLTGELGVCIADGGPGTLHLLNGLADAYSDRVPVLAITGQVARKDIGTNAKQYIDQQSLFRPISSYTSLLCDQAKITDVLGKAYRCAVTGRSVAHVSVPMDVLPLACDAQIVPDAPYLNTHPVSSTQVIDGAVAMMEQAIRPVILIGEGGRPAGALLAELSARWGAAVITTLQATGAVDCTQPLYVGGLGHAGSPAAAKILSQADVCLIAGANWWPQKYVSHNISIIQISQNPSDIGATTPVSYGVVGDIELILKHILKKAHLSSNQEWIKNISQENANWLDRLEQEVNAPVSPIHPAAVVRAVQNAVTSDTIVCLDTGDHTVWFGRIFRPDRQRVLLSGKWRSMGFGLPAALAAKINHPAQKVIALVGDGGLAMNMADFVTAVKYNLGITVIVMNNCSLSMEKNKMLAGGLNPKGTSLLNPDFAKFAECCGGKGYKVEHADKLNDVLQVAINSDIPAIVDVQVASLAVPGTALPS
ncbi:thiamine pyrophosphate-binding protein [Desulfallas thermosapovorans]|uniref:Pyruvate dehydrogenase (Quinone)/pyruvate oxidase n=1 Tax=Desulfallas thermosapovorans DSM 6562 TaxID=1121431 RepID=A0A5S4ZTI0_9FIRM|nr:thiamine pyrophosphate-binding protein [Desulfallas thermosapovorans]TYO96184.1 pyruvate dehydrogenase (quinone)/pyruvate oxidase [Desulfallas thermosapovorans DSM 6562]